MKTSKPLLLQRTATTLIDLYGSVRKAANKIGIDHTYLFRMSKGEMDNPSDEVLSKLELERIPDLEIHRRKQS